MATITMSKNHRAVHHSTNNEDIYENIQDEYAKFTQSSKYLNDGYDMSIWSMEYADKMSEDDKNILIDKYGRRKLFSMLPKIAHLNSQNTYEDFVYAVGNKEADTCNIAFIIYDEILKDFR